MCVCVCVCVCVHVRSCSVVSNSVRPPWTVAHQASLFMGFFRQESWSGLPFPPLGDLPNPGTEPSFPVSSALTGGFFSTEPLGKQRTLETREKMQGQNVVWPWRDEGDGGKLGPRVTWVALDYARRGDMALRSSASLIWCPRDPCSLLSQSFMTTSESSRVLYTVKCYAK